MRRDNYIGAASSRVALRLPGLRVHRRLRAGRLRRNPGMCGDKYIGAASSRLRCAYPGYGSTAVCGPVARVRRLRRNPGMCGDKCIGAASSRLRCVYPGYESTAVCGPVARVRRLRRNPGMRRDKSIGAASSRVALRLPGLRVLTSDSQPRSNPGLFIIALFGFPGGATGQLQIGSLGCSGMNASVRLLPGSRCAYPGYGS
ncbi:TPA: hypothetical protein RQO42_005709, partial [Klebsiella michiganensis]|nr:hypothetical protein [Klebsiella michiganensis]HDX8786293.1 hypothetical protein [Klebsiella michiganensis]